MVQAVPQDVLAQSERCLRRYTYPRLKTASLEYMRTLASQNPMGLCSLSHGCLYFTVFLSQYATSLYRAEGRMGTNKLSHNLGWGLFPVPAVPEMHNVWNKSR
jgi:hypothetical protein